MSIEMASSTDEQTNLPDMSNYDEDASCLDQEKNCDPESENSDSNLKSCDVTHCDDLAPTIQNDTFCSEERVDESDDLPQDAATDSSSSDEQQNNIETTEDQENTRTQAEQKTLNTFSEKESTENTAYKFIIEIFQKHNLDFQNVATFMLELQNNKTLDVNFLKHMDTNAWSTAGFNLVQRILIQTALSQHDKNHNCNNESLYI